VNTPNHSHQTSPSLVVAKNIVVATDLTDKEKLLPHVIAQARRSGAHVTLVHALPVPDEFILGKRTASAPDAREAQARQTLADMAQRVEMEGIPCSIILKRGVAVDIVHQEIEDGQADRLIIGTHGHGYAGQKILGCVANALLRAVNVPVYVIGPHATSTPSHVVPHRILHPVSLTGQYRASAAFALALAQANRADLTLLHVLDAGMLRGAHFQEISAKAKQGLSELIPSQHPPIAVHTLVECGDAPFEILRVCAATESDWIVMGIERDFPWGSMSNNAAYQVIAQADRPVLVVRDHAIAERLAHTVEAELVSVS